MPMIKNNHQIPKILLIGPLPDTEKSATQVIGGTKMVTAESIHELGMRGFELDVLDSLASVTNLPLWKIQAIRLARFLRVVWKVVRKVRHARLVFLIIAPYSAIILALSVWAICKIAHRPMVLRFSGASLNSVYRQYGTLARWLADRTYMCCALIYVETQQLCRDFDNPTNFRWFPNTRDVAAPVVVRRRELRKLIFVARLEMDKGLAEALDACRHLPKNCRLQVFGPRMPDTDFSLFEGHPRAVYGGVLGPGEVPRFLSEHDLLLFPSYYRGEGYPGVILEAFQCGLPVVAARWGGVPELVEHEENGLLVKPRSAAAIKSAIERLLNDPDLYWRLCKGAQRRGEYFRSANWYGRMASDLHNLINDTPSPRLPRRPDY